MSSRLGMKREQCSSCGLPVFLAEKLVVDRSTYHRSCFRCARCRHQLTFHNYYETESGQYCCEACPDLEVNGLNDEQQQQHLLTTSGRDLDDPMLEAPVSDEEKSKRRSLEHHASVEHFLRKQRAQLELVSSHLLGNPGSKEEDRVDSTEREIESDKQKSTSLANAGLLALPNDNDNKFDEMIKRISERIDELTTDDVVGQPQQNKEKKAKQEGGEKDEKVEKEETHVRTASPDTRLGRDVNRVNSVPDLEAEFKRANNEHDNKKDRKEEEEGRGYKEQEKRRRRSLPREGKRRNSSSGKREESSDEAVLRRSSSLRSSAEYTEGQEHQQSRRLSLVQRRLQLFEQPNNSERMEQHPPISPRQPKQPKIQPKQQQTNVYPEELNPFASDVDDEEENKKRKKKEKPSSTNPFGSSSNDEDEKESQLPKPVIRSNKFETTSKRLIEAPKINLNPFWSDGEEPENGAESEPELRNKSLPVPRPRTLKYSHMDGINTLQPRSNPTSSSIHSSNTSIASACSTMTQGGTYRKKKPAPPPPTVLNESTLGTPNRTLNVSSTSSNPSLSPRLTPRTRKSKPAPLPPPMATSTPSRRNVRKPSSLPENESPTVQSIMTQEQPTPKKQEERQPEKQHIWDEEKLSKDEANRNTQSLSYNDNTAYFDNYGLQDKNLDGKWKRKKGPAPARPMPLRRKIKVISMKDVKLELDQIEMQQQGLEKQGVRLEQIIRDKCESDGVSEEISLGLEVEELMLELFALVNEKNELFRRQAELMLLRRQQRLEEEHADIEYQVRCLISQPEATKTDFDKQREEALIERLVKIVERRNEIVECLEMDRKREIEEDRSINREMDLYAARNKADNINMTDESRRASKQKGKVKEKVKEKKSKKSNKKDADKDVDETESKHKHHNLRKWF